MIRHAVMFRMASGTEFDDAKGILDELPGKVPQIRGWHVSKNEGRPDDGVGASDFWDILLVADFESWEDLAAYEGHPFHLDVVARLTPMFTARAITDFDVGVPKR